MARLNQYLRLLGARVYRPVKPVVAPLLSRVKLVYILVVLVVLALAGGAYLKTSPSAQERAAWWPWSKKAHGEMAIAWFEAGNEEKALKELELSGGSLKRAEEVVESPKRIREEIVKWEKFLDERPFDQGVLLRLAVLNWQVYDDQKAKDYFDRAEYIDPNNEIVEKVRVVIFSDL